MWSSTQIVQTFIEFYQSHDHRRIEGSGLVPPPDDPVLFITSGMHPLIPYLGGRPHPQGRRLVNRQRCLRTTDLEEVGDRSHLTVFQMLGSWSLGDYSGLQSLRWGWQLLTQGFGISPDRLCVSVWEGDHRCEPDHESEKVWSELGLSPDRIHRLLEDNWWGPVGESGPCGPDSEIFYWTGDDPPSPDITHPGWIEIWNHVMMRYDLGPSGLTPLPYPNVDTGMGLERMGMVLNGHGCVYETDSFEPWMSWLNQTYELSESGQRLLGDHLRSSLVLEGEGIRPQNTGRGYVLRRLLRRVFREMGPGQPLEDLPPELVSHTEEIFGMKLSDPNQMLTDERERYRRLLERGRREVSKLLRKGPLGREQLHYLYETHGLSQEISLQIQRELL